MSHDVVYCIACAGTLCEELDPPPEALGVPSRPDIIYVLDEHTHTRHTLGQFMTRTASHGSSRALRHAQRTVRVALTVGPAAINTSTDSLFRAPHALAAGRTSPLPSLKMRAVLGTASVGLAVCHRSCGGAGCYRVGSSHQGGTSSLYQPA